SSLSLSLFPGKAVSRASMHSPCLRVILADRSTLSISTARIICLRSCTRRPDVALQQSHARELVALAPEVILTTTTPATQALRDATRTIPIAFVNLSDPVATGVVSNLARPKANLTGFMYLEHSMAGKWLSLRRDRLPAWAYRTRTAVREK